MEGVARILELLQAASSAPSRSKLKNQNKVIDFSAVFRRAAREGSGYLVGEPVEGKRPLLIAQGELQATGAGARGRLTEGQAAPGGQGENGRGNDPAELPAALDPLTLALALPAAPRPAAGTELTPRADFANAVEELVRRIAWGGDRSSGTARIEFGSGRYRGGIILVRAEGRDVTVELELPSGADGAELGSRLRARLEEKGLSLSEVRIR
jgi:hypothetical protein